MRNSYLPQSIEECHKIIELQADKIDQLTSLIERQANQHAAQIEQLEAKVNWFTGQFRLAQHRKFGASSEQSKPALQMNLFNEAEVIADTEPFPPEE